MQALLGLMEAGNHAQGVELAQVLIAHPNTHASDRAALVRYAQDPSGWSQMDDQERKYQSTISSMAEKNFHAATGIWLWPSEGQQALTAPPKQLAMTWTYDAKRHTWQLPLALTLPSASNLSDEKKQEEQNDAPQQDVNKDERAQKQAQQTAAQGSQTRQDEKHDEPPPETSSVTGGRSNKRGKVFSKTKYGSRNAKKQGEKLHKVTADPYRAIKQSFNKSMMHNIFDAKDLDLLHKVKNQEPITDDEVRKILSTWFSKDQEKVQARKHMGSHCKYVDAQGRTLLNTSIGHAGRSTDITFHNKNNSRTLYAFFEKIGFWAAYEENKGKLRMRGSNSHSSQPYLGTGKGKGKAKGRNSRNRRR